jgi:hypothetical protein
MSLAQGSQSSDTIRAQLHDIDHQICEGIRHGDIAEVMLEFWEELVSRIKIEQGHTEY